MGVILSFLEWPIKELKSRYSVTGYSFFSIARASFEHG